MKVTTAATEHRCIRSRFMSETSDSSEVLFFFAKDTISLIFSRAVSSFNKLPEDMWWKRVYSLECLVTLAHETNFVLQFK
jgi:hypothetical protein